MHIIVGLIVFVLFLAAIAPFAKRLAAGGAEYSDFVADPNNKNSVLVRGWSRSELERLLGDFLKSYDLPQSTLKIATESDGTSAITFPNDIEPRLLYFLVNYINYPKDLDLTNRSIAVLGEVVLTPFFEAPDQTLVGTRAKIYVPADDRDYDLVYAKVESEQAYRIRFTNLKWKAVDDPRLPEDVARMYRNW